MPFLTRHCFSGTIALTLLAFAAPAATQPAGDRPPRGVEIGPGGQVVLEKPQRTKLEEAYELHAHALWESRYVTEGRDNLSGNSIYSASTEFAYEGINILPWIADAAGTDYTEFNLNMVYGFRPLGNLELFAGYTYVYARESNISADDNEISLGLVYFRPRQFHVSTVVNYSFEADGTFTEVAIDKGYRMSDALSFDASASIGFNAGYVVDGHNGINHGQLLARANYHVIDRLDIYAYTGYNKAINSDSQRYAGDETLRDFFWGGAGLSYRF